MLVTEISNIYKKMDRTRKNHNLVFMPDMNSAETFNAKLDAIGNIQSDGRPILGLDARNLLEIVLETDTLGYLIPAHVWTPWFSLLGSKSGFDSVEACFEDLTSHVFALETGLSSDPAMNWRISGLDQYTLVSNSDAHSPSKLGREANCFDTDLSFGAIRTALETSDPNMFLGTYEFYPEQGKYHVDGHRKCGFRCAPIETRKLNNICPKCGKPLTLGVLYRVESLADRHDGRQPPKAATFRSLIPLEEILSEVLQVGPKTKTVVQAYDRLIHDLGPELDILCRVPYKDLDSCGIALLAEAIVRMRDGRVNFDAGYDGEFGQVRIFDPAERKALQGQQNLFDVPCEISCPSEPEHEPLPYSRTALQTELPSDRAKSEKPKTIELNAQQQAVVDHGRGTLCIVAGPGTGKTRTITCRMSALMEREIDTILAVTFTNKAATEMRRRLQEMQGKFAQDADLPVIATFHGFCWQLLQEIYDHCYGAIIDDQGRAGLLADAVALARAEGEDITLSATALLDLIVQAKQRLLGHEDNLNPVVDDPHQRRQLTSVYGRYQNLLRLQERYDYEDLIFEIVKILETEKKWRKTIQKRFSHIFIDEFQDINYGQYRLLRLLTAHRTQLCAIGDPDQAIYGFRGSDVRYFQQLSHDYADTRVVQLSQNYRSSTTILKSCYHVIRGHQIKLSMAEQRRIHSDIHGISTITVMETASSKAEAVAIGRTIENMVGGIGFHSLDFDKLDDRSISRECSFNDFAVLCRTGEQAQFIARTLLQAGIPTQLASRNALNGKSVLTLLAACKVVKDLGTYIDFSLLTGLGPLRISQESLSMFKRWAYAKQLPIATALHAVNRFPIPGLTTQRQKRLAALIRLLDNLRKASLEMTVAETLIHIVDQTQLSSRVDSQDLQNLVDAAEPFGRRADKFIAALALRSDTDCYHAHFEKVAVMTLHASKGLEFPVVFVAGCEDGIIPYQRADTAPSDLDEERRLFYVAMTRAQERLFLTWAGKRTRHGKTIQTRRSPFVADIEKQLIDNQSAQRLPRKASQQQLSLF
jgi:uncharacterized protein (TIGR00375 family)